MSDRVGLVEREFDHYYQFDSPGCAK